MRQWIIVVRPGDPGFDSEITSSLKGAVICETVTWEDALQQPARAASARLVVVVLRDAGDNGMRVMAAMSSVAQRPRILALLPAEPGPSLWDAATNAADDFLVGPVRPEEFQRRVFRLLPVPSGEPEEIAARLIEEVAIKNLVGEAAEFRAQVARIPACAGCDHPVLITGESGTGKELFARAIHQLSRRRDAPFIPLDCGSVPDHLFENELFGHSRGAFTDAHRDQKGLVAMAAKGTLFLDEIDCLSAAAQGKLLRFLQEHTYRPLGSERFLEADVRILAATNGDLEACVERRQFRNDLFHRINVLRLRLPALRQRPSDVPLLAEHFLRGTPGGAGRRFSPAAMDVLRSQSWEGNVRQLQNVILQATTFCREARIDAADLPLATPKPPNTAASFRDAKRQTVFDFERAYVQKLLEKHKGNITQAAKEAGKDRRVFGRMVQKYFRAAGGGQ